MCGLCVLSICSCRALPRWCLGPFCVRASSIALLDNLKERHVARFEDFFFFFVAGTVRAVVFSPAGPFVFEGSRVLS